MYCQTLFNNIVKIVSNIETEVVCIFGDFFAQVHILKYTFLTKNILWLVLLGTCCSLLKRSLLAMSLNRYHSAIEG